MSGEEIMTKEYNYFSEPISVKSLDAKISSEGTQSGAVAILITCIPRNPLIADVCYRAGYIDTWGRGIQKIFLACRESGLNEPQFEDVFGGLRVTLTGGRLKSTSETVAKTGSEKSSEKSSEKILTLLVENPSLSAKDLAEAVGMSSRAVEKQLAVLKNKGRLKRIGPAKGGCRQAIVNDEE